MSVDARVGRLDARGRWPFATAALFLLLAGVYIYLASWRYDIFRAGVDDCIFTQVANSLLTGFSSTIEGSVNHFLVHFSPIFVGPLSSVRAGYLFGALLPLAFLPLFSRYVLFALPGLAEVLLSHEGVTMSLGAHYTATWSGYLLCAFVDGLSSAYQRWPVAAKGGLAFAMVASVWTSRYHSPIDPAFALYRQPNAADRIRERELVALPRDASLGSGPWVLPHVAMNPQATVAMTEGEEYLVFDHFTDPSYWIAADRPTIRRLTGSRTYEQVYSGAGVVVLRRIDR